MLDVTSSLAPILYEAMRGEREREFDARRWNRRLRELRARDRRKAERCTPAPKPASLSGAPKI